MALNANKELAFGLLEKVARLECAMKFGKYCKQASRGKLAEPDWDSFIRDAGKKLSDLDEDEIINAVKYLVEHPPKVQKYEGGKASFQEQALRFECRGENALEAAKRVRNNLFHGGKHTGHKEEEIRNDVLLRLAALVIDKTAELIDADFYNDYRQLA